MIAGYAEVSTKRVLHAVRTYRKNLHRVKDAHPSYAILSEELHTLASVSLTGKVLLSPSGCNFVSQVEQRLSGLDIRPTEVIKITNEDRV